MAQRKPPPLKRIALKYFHEGLANEKFWANQYETTIVAADERGKEVLVHIEGLTELLWRARLAFQSLPKDEQRRMVSEAESRVWEGENVPPEDLTS